MAVKKAFGPLVDFLTENKDKKVSTILDDAIAMCTAKTAGGSASASHTTEDGRLFIRCSFFELWFPVSHVEFGKKEGTSTGYNPMCKEGANQFSALQRAYRSGKEALLDKVAQGEVKPEKIEDALAELEAARTNRPAYSVPGMGWPTKEEAAEVSEEELDALIPEEEPEEEVEADDGE